MLRKRLMMSKRMNVGYISYGCYIQDTDGKFWDRGTWDGTATFNGVAIYTEDYAFLVSGTIIKSAISDGFFSFGNKYSTEDEAKLDFDGYGNTAYLDADDSGYITLKNNLFPDGEQGYIPSLGELLVLYQYKNDIFALLNEVGIDTTDITDNTYWSSTAMTGYTMKLWRINFSTGAISTYTASGKYMIWPIKTLWIKGVTPKIENKISIRIDLADDTTELPNGTIINRSYKYPISEFPVFSDLEVLCNLAQSGNRTYTINKGKTKSGNMSLTSEKFSIISVNPTEDDKYIYVVENTYS